MESSNTLMVLGYIQSKTIEYILKKQNMTISDIPKIELQDIKERFEKIVIKVDYLKEIETLYKQGIITKVENLDTKNISYKLS